MRRCRRCGEYVTADFARVFGDNRDEIVGCLSCQTAREIYRGAATTGDATTATE